VFAPTLLKPHIPCKENPFLQSSCFNLQWPQRVWYIFTQCCLDSFSKSRITTPTPEEWEDLKVAPSTLSLYNGAFGKDHGAFSLDPPGLSLMLAVWNSSRKNWARCKSADPYCIVFPSRASLLLNHMHHATMTTNSNSSWPNRIPNIRCQRKSTNSGKANLCASKEMPVRFQTTHAQSQPQKRWPLLSAPIPHASHTGSVRTFRWHKLSFVGRIFLLARHTKDLTLFGMLSR